MKKHTASPPPPLATRRNYCNLDLCLLTPSSSEIDLMPKTEGSEQMTIFYNGNICVSDVTHLQARVILHHASKETDDEMARTPHNSSVSQPASPSLTPSQLYSPTTGLSLKTSLQRFHDLDLCLLTPSPSENHRDLMLKTEGLEQMTIFYYENICVSDVTQLQARVILYHASSKETDDEMLRTPHNSSKHLFKASPYQKK